MSAQKLLTAAEAEKISRSKDPAYAVEAILDGVRKAADAGQRSYRTYEFGFGGAEVHRSEKDWPELNRHIVAELRKLGYRADVRADYKQFADIYLMVEWGAAA